MGRKDETGEAEEEEVTRRTLAIIILARYNVSAAEYDDTHEFKCRRCCNVVGWDFGGDDGVCGGLCDDCWVAVRPLVRIAGLDPDLPEQLQLVFPEAA